MHRVKDTWASVHVVSHLEFGKDLLALAGIDSSMLNHVRNFATSGKCMVEQRDCRCTKLCLKHILRCHSCINAGIDVAATMVLENNYRDGHRRFERYVDVECESLLWVAPASECPIVSVQLRFPSYSIGQAGFVLGWSDTDDRIKLLDSVFNAGYASTWHVRLSDQGSGSMVQWCAVGNTEGPYPCSLPFGVYGRRFLECKLTLSIMSTSMALFCDGRHVSSGDFKEPTLDCNFIKTAKNFFICFETRAYDDIELPKVVSNISCNSTFFLC